ncbi:MAG: hypothetical protein P9L94_03035 [Candidatus Hinthialibacter antarcticus]|nr:hypothetical protein [Candidatus Hinthialibacter antarcticus]
MKYISSLIAFSTISLFSLTVTAVEFDTPLTLVESTKALEFARNPRGALGVDQQGRVHLTYSLPDGDMPGDQIMYVSFLQEQIETPVRVDNETFGGKHPFMVVAPGGDVTVIWQDYRNATAAGNFIDNIEIYLDRMPLDGSFSDSDVRISNTSAGHSGDNGYTPTISISPNAITYAAWYDFSLDGNNSNIYVRSNSNGEFSDVGGIEPFRITGEDLGGDLTSHWMPDVAGMLDGAYVVWGVQDNFQSYLRLQGRMVNADGSLGEVEAITEDASTFFDPPRIIANEQGEIFLAFSQRVDGLSHVYLMKRSTSGAWSDAAMIDDGSLSASQLSVVNAGDQLYAVWQEDLGGIFQVVFAVVDPNTFEVSERIYLSGDFDDARTPTIGVQPMASGFGQISVVWIERDDEGNRSIVLRQKVGSVVDNWDLH